MAIFDEVQNLLTDKQHGEQAARGPRLRDPGRPGLRHHRRPVHPAAGREDHPDRDHGLIISRFCLMVPDQPANDLVLGTSVLQAGL